MIYIRQKFIMEAEHKPRFQKCFKLKCVQMAVLFFSLLQGLSWVLQVLNCWGSCSLHRGDSFCDDKCQESCPASSSGQCPSHACLSRTQLSRSSRTFSYPPTGLSSVEHGVHPQSGLLGAQMRSSSSPVYPYCFPPCLGL